MAHLKTAPCLVAVVSNQEKNFFWPEIEAKLNRKSVHGKLSIPAKLWSKNVASNFDLGRLSWSNITHVFCQ